MGSSGTVRVSVKAVVISEGRILLVKQRDPEGEWFSLPGGGQRQGETLPQAIERECLEEIGVGVRLGRLLWIRDYIADHHEFAAEEGGAHQLELMFECELAEDRAPGLGANPDDGQIGVEWVPVERLRTLRMYPRAVARILADGVPRESARYLGDVN